MKKNIIFLLVDCFDYNKIGGNQYRQSPTPFLDGLKKKSLWVEKMYSQAPYTEAALIATMCGYDTLDRGGYLKRYKNCPETLFEMVQKAGYQVYAQMWTHFYPSSAIRGIDELQLRPFSFKALWVYRFEYYSNLYAEGKIDSYDMIDLIDILKENLYFWQDYYDMLLARDDKVRIICENMDITKVFESRDKLQVEINKFKEHPTAYITSILCEKTNHILFSLFDEECLDEKVPKDFVEKISKKYGTINGLIRQTNDSRNIKNNHVSVRRLLEYYRRSENPLNLKKRTPFSQYLRNYYHITHYDELEKCIDANYDQRKDWLSTHRMMEYFLDWEEVREKENKPYFAYMHTEDIHGQCTVFDICSRDENSIDKQMLRIKNFIDHLPQNYKGNLGYDLGLLNLDSTIEWFYNTLKERGILENTLLIITSDHGCGTNYFPLRGEIQNFHDECYHVPFIVVGAGIEPCIDTDFHITKDIMATMADLIETEVPNMSTGISIFSDKKRKYINQEYMGPGCPDMFRRPIWMCAFDVSWKVFLKIDLQQEVFNYNLEEIYNLESDPNEMRNLVLSGKARRQVAYLICELKKRWETIKKGYSRDEQYEE